MDDFNRAPIYLLSESSSKTVVHCITDGDSMPDMDHSASNPAPKQTYPGSGTKNVSKHTSFLPVVTPSGRKTNLKFRSKLIKSLSKSIYLCLLGCLLQFCLLVGHGTLSITFDEVLLGCGYLLFSIMVIILTVWIHTSFSHWIKALRPTMMVTSPRLLAKGSFVSLYSLHYAITIKLWISIMAISSSAISVSLWSLIIITVYSKTNTVIDEGPQNDDTQRHFLVKDGTSLAIANLVLNSCQLGISIFNVVTAFKAQYLIAKWDTISKQISEMMSQEGLEIKMTKGISQPNLLTQAPFGKTQKPDFYSMKTAAEETLSPSSPNSTRCVDNNSGHRYDELYDEDDA